MDTIDKYMERLNGMMAIELNKLDEQIKLMQNNLYWTN
jgi:hypothetical protein